MNAQHDGIGLRFFVFELYSWRWFIYLYVIICVQGRAHHQLRPLAIQTNEYYGSEINRAVQSNGGQHNDRPRVRPAENGLEHGSVPSGHHHGNDTLCKLIGKRRFMWSLLVNIESSIGIIPIVWLCLYQITHVHVYDSARSIYLWIRSSHYADIFSGSLATAVPIRFYFNVPWAISYQLL